MSLESTRIKDRYRVIACRECRRSKTKCTRKWPCQACIKRGCEDICPEGILIKPSYKQNIESLEITVLREENERLIAHIQQLEKAAPLSLPSSGHKVSSTSEEASATPPSESSQEDIVDAFGTLSIGYFGQSNHRNQAASAEYLLENGVELLRGGIALEGTALPGEILHLAELFPHGRSTRPNAGLEHLIMSFIPPADEVLNLVDRYYSHMAWMYDPVPRDQFMNRVYNRIFYDMLDVTFDHVALLFIILALGVLLDLDRPFNYGDSEPYYLLGLAAFSLEANLTAPTLASIQTLQLISIYTCLSERTSAEERWLLMGTTIRLTQCAGLYRDLSSWLKYDPSEVERRRKLFWELFVYDTWTSFVMGRPAVLGNTRQIETKFPQDPHTDLSISGEPDPNFHSWKYQFAKDCLIPLLDKVLGAEPPTYQTILQLDTSIRRFSVPPSLQLPPLDGVAARNHVGDVSLEMQKYFVIFLKETTLLYLHRSFFAHALAAYSSNPLRSKYAASVLAAYRSASLLVGRLRQLNLEQPLTARIWTFWSSLFSGAIVLGTLVVRSPSCQLSSSALSELDLACQLLEQGIATPRSAKASATLQHLQRKAHEAHRKQSARTEMHDGTAERDTEPADDELTIFGGQTRLILAAGPASAGRADTSKHSAGLRVSQPPNIPTHDAHPELWNDISTLTSFDALSELASENVSAFQGTDDVIPDLTGLNFGMNCELPKLQDIDLAAQRGQQTTTPWQDLISEVGILNTESV